MLGTDFASLVQANAFTLIGTINRLLKQIDKACGLSEAPAYMAKATAAGSHEELIRISWEYASTYCSVTLDVRCDADFFVALARGEAAPCNSEWAVNV